MKTHASKVAEADEQRNFGEQVRDQPTITPTRHSPYLLRVVMACTLIVTIGSLSMLVSFDEGRRLSNNSYAALDIPQQEANMKDRNKDDPTLTVMNITCENDREGPCCAPWEYNADDWWLHHPDWEISHESETQFCFSKIQDTAKAEFFQKIHDVQWNANCSNIVQRNQINSGWAASFGRVCDAMWAAVNHGIPVQMTKHWDGMQWLYASNDTSSWAYCENMDMSCYILPLSKCPRVIGRNDDVRKTGGKRGSVEWLWLKQYVGRMQQHVRKRIHEMLQNEFPPVQLPCTAMHVRRGDSGITRRPFRRYAAISEYLERGEIEPGDNIVLLTDDSSTIQEVQEYHPNYNWIYANRPRNNGTDAGFDGHIPSSDPAYDFVVIQAELRLASQCTKFVHGSSSFADMVHDAMLGAGTNVTRYVVNTSVSKEEAQKNYTGDIKARGNLMLNEIQAAYERKQLVSNEGHKSKTLSGW